MKKSVKKSTGFSRKRLLSALIAVVIAGGLVFAVTSFAKGGHGGRQQVKKHQTKKAKSQSFKKHKIHHNVATRILYGKPNPNSAFCKKTKKKYGLHLTTEGGFWTSGKNVPTFIKNKFEHQCSFGIAVLPQVANVQVTALLKGSPSKPQLEELSGIAAGAPNVVLPVKLPGAKVVLRGQNGAYCYAQNETAITQTAAPQSPNWGTHIWNNCEPGTYIAAGEITKLQGSNKKVVVIPVSTQKVLVGPDGHANATVYFEIKENN